MYTDYSSTPAAAPSPMGLIASLLFAVVMIVALWKVFTKAGRPGWAAIVPFYNIYMILKLAGRPGWWLLLMFIPFVNVIVWLVVSIDLAKTFGKSTLFGVIGLWLFSVVGYLMLGFGKAVYTAPGSSAAPDAPVAPAAPVPPATPLA